MSDFASVDATLHVIRNIAMGGIVFFCLVGLDLIMGGHAMKILGHIFNKSFDVDSLIISGLSSLRQGSEKRMMNVDEAMQKSRGRVFIGSLLLVPAALLILLVIARR